MTHLTRAGILLVAVLIAAFIVPRIIPVPDSLVKFGFDKVNVVQNNQDWASRPLQYADTQVCNDCHTPQYVVWQLGDHTDVSCETCHAPAYDHVTGGPPPEIDRTQGLCVNCHGEAVSRPRGFPQVDPEAHSAGLNCITCHNPHEPRQYIAPVMPHPIEGRENCASCHLPNAPIDTPPPIVMHDLQGREDCASCHAPGLARNASTGIPLIPHPTEGRDNCVLCHGAETLVAYPPDHQGRTTDMCRTCHQTTAEAAAAREPAVTPAPTETPATEPTATEPAATPTATATATPEPTGTEPAGPPSIPHSLDGRDNCLLCHDIGGLKPFPADHEGRTTDLCRVCHKTGS